MPHYMCVLVLTHKVCFHRYQDKDQRRFAIMFFLTGGYFLVEIIWGVAIESLALVADAMHMLSDVIALVVGFYALKVSY